MSELSKDARDLVATLTDNDYRYGDVVLDRDEWLRIARAALELAGYKLAYQDCVTEKGDGYTTDSRLRGYSLGESEDVVLVSQDKGEPPTVDILGYRSDMEKYLVESAAILLHAAATAGEWESEGK